MNYELAKCLKEAGFPQEPKPHSEQSFVFENDGGDGGSFYVVCPMREEGDCYVDLWRPKTYQQYFQDASDPISTANNPPEKVVKLPTLSELIAAVLQLVPDEPAAYSFELRFQQYEANPGTEPLEISWKWVAAIEPTIHMTGNSPEEAVGRLWLALKQKS